MRAVQHDQDISAFEADALFVSALHCSEALSVGQVRQAIDAAVREFGFSGCAGRVAQEFGDHPEAAVVRMRWARATASSALRDQGAEDVVPTPSRSPDLTALCAA